MTKGALVDLFDAFTQAIAGQPAPRNGLLHIGGSPMIANVAAPGLRKPSVVDPVVARGGLPDYAARLFTKKTTAPLISTNARPIPLVMAGDAAPAAATAKRTLEVCAAGNVSGAVTSNSQFSSKFGTRADFPSTTKER
jgi:hypothetical protein